MINKQFNQTTSTNRQEIIGHLAVGVGAMHTGARQRSGNEQRLGLNKEDQTRDQKAAK